LSLVQDLLDRLTGVSALRERLNDIKASLADQQRFLLDHERRLARLEGQQPPPKRALSKRS
jgi:hypothetical protein